MKNYYAHELKALEKSHRLRTRKLYDETSIDLASNDYLGLATQPSLKYQAFAMLESAKVHAPMASMLVNGYHALHAQFEEALCRANGFEAGVLVGSGFAANIALIEALVRKGDRLLMDERYHASGQLAARLVDGEVATFAHNDANALEHLLQNSKGYKRTIIAVEGIYSMDADRCERAIIELALRYDAILVMDEAHSSGVIGAHLMGIFDYYGMEIAPNFIKMGTLGKAYGSFGAYILASQHIIDYLINRAKPLIYATSLSLFDTALGIAALEYIHTHTEALRRAIEAKQAKVASLTGYAMAGLIWPIEIGDNVKVLAIQEALKAEHISVGAIRQPTVPRAIVRVITRLGTPDSALERVAFHLHNLG
ncbi:MAG: 8-amino-7-oxononanoate synthase [Sulfuricurvum sp. PC08-66]|nr:MAG: 8-amino-7-oxononanoate synthase [Sulfuricurvum sp. PC08-66]